MLNYKSILVLVACITLLNTHSNLIAKNETIISKTVSTKETPQIKSWDVIFEDAKKAVVQIYTYCGEHQLLAPYKAPQVQLGRGTGFFLEQKDEDEGCLCTNYHVISDAIANGIYIRIPELGQEQFAVEIVAVYPSRDLAKLKLTAPELARLKSMLKVEKLPFLPLAENSDNVKEAQELMLVGFPLGHTKIKASLGECSGWCFDARIGNMVQTTVPTNGGNSGGPYLNNKGEVVGVCCQKATGQNVDSIAYFIPINTVHHALLELNNNQKKIISPLCWGWEFTPTTNHLNRCIACPIEGGIYLNNVMHGGLAHEHGFLPGDLLYSINGLAINQYGDVKPENLKTNIELHDYISRLPLKSTIAFKLYRKGIPLEINVTTKEADHFTINSIYYGLQEPDFEMIGGLVLVDLTLDHIEALSSLWPAITQYYRPNKRLEGHVLIINILPSSAASRANCFTHPDNNSRVLFEDNGFVSTINGINVHSIQEVRDALQATKHHEYVIIQTNTGVKAALSVSEIIEQEDALAEQHGYTKSKLIDVLAEGRKRS